MKREASANGALNRFLGEMIQNSEKAGCNETERSASDYEENSDYRRRS